MLTGRIVKMVLASLFCCISAMWLLAADDVKPQTADDKASNAAEVKKEAKAETAWAPAVKPKKLSKNVKQGLAWLAEHQLSDGAWGQGEESANMGRGTQMKDVPSVADTCMAALALIRSGSTPEKGPYADKVLKAVNFVCGEVEKSDKDSLSVTSTKGTRVQSKLGQYIDTFTASLLLAEVQDRMPDAESKKRASEALNKVLHKIQKNQRPDGTWAADGWAGTLSQGMAVKGLNRAAQAGKPVAEPVRKLAEESAQKSFDRASGKFSAAGSAGVELYSAGSNLGALSDSVNTNRQQEADVLKEMQTAKTPDKREEAKAKLDRFKVAQKDLSAAQDAVIKRLDDQQFVAGFGSNGGEEFLSYMNIGESLVVKGGDNWKSWDKSITDNLNRIQNQDGSWTGHHCITGRTFCTAAALLVLMVDRSPVPTSAKLQQR